MKNAIRLSVFLLCLILVSGSLNPALALQIDTTTQAFVAGATPDETLQDSDSDPVSAYSSVQIEKGTVSDPELEAEAPGNYETSSAAAYGDAARIRASAAHHVGSSGGFEGPGDGSAAATVHWQDTLDLTGYSTYGYLFHIDNGSLDLYARIDQDEGTPITLTTSASYSIDIRINSVSVWESGATLSAEFDGSGWTVTDSNESTADNRLAINSNASGTSGTTLDEYVSYAPTTVGLSLDSLTGQDNVLIEYILTLSVSEVMTGNGDDDIFTDMQNARFGDPPGGYGGITATAVPGEPAVSTIPEPGTLLLFGFGLLGLARAGRAQD